LRGGIREVHLAAKSPKQRKSDFDRIMRNKGQKERPDEPERMPCVLFLCAEARQELALQRQADRSVGVKPLLDSVFVERAILKQPRGRTRELPITDAAKQLSKSRKANEELLRKYQTLESSLVPFRLEFEKLRRQAADRSVPAQHEARMSPEFMRLLQGIKREIGAGRTALHEAQAIHKLVGTYLQFLCR